MQSLTSWFLADSWQILADFLLILATSVENENVKKIMLNSMILEPSDPKINQNGAQERSKSDIGSKSFSRTTKSERSGCFF